MKKYYFFIFLKWENNFFLFSRKNRKNNFQLFSPLDNLCPPMLETSTKWMLWWWFWKFTEIEITGQEKNFQKLFGSMLTRRKLFWLSSHFTRRLLSTSVCVVIIFMSDIFPLYIKCCYQNNFFDYDQNHIVGRNCNGICMSHVQIFTL